MTTIQTEILRQGSDGEVIDIVKATVFSSEVAVPGANAVDPEDRRAFYVQGGMIEPPYDMRLLVNLYEMSSNLRPNVDAYITNIDAFGHTFEPIFNWDSKDVQERIGNAIYIDRMAAASVDPSLPDAELPTDEEIKSKIEEIKKEMRFELAKLNGFFDSCVIGGSFVQLRKKTRQDVEVLGNGYWEVLRDSLGEMRFFNYVPAFTVMIGRLGQAVETEVMVKQSELTQDVIRVPRRFRSYAQVVTESNARVYFKEFGDPRTMSAASGKFYDSIEALKQAEDTAKPATELLHFAIHSTRTPYGVPRWIGALLSVLGTRQAEEVNFLFFESKSIPPMAILISGGRMAAGGADKLSEFIKEEVKGKKNFHKILVIEAEPVTKHLENSGRFKIELKPLTQFIQSDALFQGYDERNADKVGQQFRLPRMIRGDIRDFNKSTSESALLFTEMQVFQPEREDFDTSMNKSVIEDLSIKFWKLMSRSPVTRDPVTMANMISLMVQRGVLIPDEGRMLAADIFNREFKRIDERWAQQPLQLTMAELQVKAKELAAGVAPQEEPKPGDPKVKPKEQPAPDLKKIAKAFLDLNAFLDEHEASASFVQAKADQEKQAKVEEELETVTITVPAAKMLEWIEPDPT